MTEPHQKSEHRHVYVLTCIDSFTKWAEAFPIRNKETEMVARVLVEQVFYGLGTPVSALSDQGKEVDDNIMKGICRLLGTDKLRTSPYKPSTNQVERLHNSLNSVLGKIVAIPISATVTRDLVLQWQPIVRVVMKRQGTRQRC